MAVTKIIGAAVKRKEDPRFITGTGQYTDDVRVAGTLHMAILRSPHAHARIRRIDATRARQHPGVVGVFTGQDLKAGGVNPIPVGWLLPDIKIGPHFPLAVDRARYVGDGVAAVVADSAAAAKDAVELVAVDYEPLEPAVDLERAIEAGASQVHDEAPNNVAFVFKVGGGDLDKAFAEAEVVVKQRILNQRLIPNAMEPRAALAQYDVGKGELTLWNTNQNPHIIRLLLALTLGFPEHKLRVVSPDVGGGFGSKIYLYADEVVACFASMKLGRPVKWFEERRENYVATVHGRGHVTDVEAAAKRDGTILGMRVRTLADMGAYLSPFAPLIPTFLYVPMLAGPYTMQAVHGEVLGVYTNTTMVDAYRGAGRPEATYLIERVVDLVAREVGLDPAEVRRRNVIPPFTNHQTPIAYMYDSGNYPESLEKALKLADYDRLRKEQADLRRQGRYIGIGLATYVEVTGAAPAQVAASLGAQAGLIESAIVRVHPTGKVNVYTGSHSHGQGHETTFAQLVAGQLGIPLDDITVVHGDTAAIPWGAGTYGSRSQPVGGAAIYHATERVIDKGKKIAAHLLEASEDDVVFEAPQYKVKGVPDKAVTFQDVALEAYWPRRIPMELEPGLEANAFFNPSNFTFPAGTHVAVVEVDAETGDVAMRSYVAVDDVGRVINPMIVDGQVHGGIAQGAAQALWEEAVYDERGQLVSGSMMDYAVPTAEMLPPFQVGRIEVPTPVNPLGAKGAGETGTIASTAAVANAVIDALAPFGVKHIDMPLKPEKVWRAIRQAQTAGR
ncbi:MAG: xanthine dehydrogenase family protein [Chloroflexi bacterium]|nr:xanthine dehydrogenase family protein [Chloroflexota bacterium]